MNLIQGRGGMEGGREGEGKGEGGRDGMGGEGERREGGRDDCYTHSNRYVQWQSNDTTIFK